MSSLINKKILFVSNDLDFFLSHRLPLALTAVEKGYIVYVASDKIPNSKIENIIFKKFSISRSSISIFSILNSLIGLKKIINQVTPDIVHSVTLKSILISNLLLILNKKILKINAVTGMGYLFTSNRFSLVLLGLKFIFKILIFKGRPNFIFQNTHDLNEFKKLGLKDNYSLIKGSGVNKGEFDYTPQKSNKKVNITFTGRILKDKGVVDLIRAIELLPDKVKSEIKVNLFGKIDLQNPAHIKEDQQKNLLIPNLIFWHGHSENIKDHLIDSDIYCLPSYREGLPKSTVEAMAIGRPIITTNAPGCEDTVQEGFNGFKVDIGDIEGLSKKLQLLVENKELRIKMGKNSRDLFLKNFTLEKVVTQTFELYDRLLSIRY